MAAIKKHWEAVAALLCVAVIITVTALALWPRTEYNDEMQIAFEAQSRRYLFYAALGILAGSLMLLVKEHHLHRSAWAVFCVFMAVLIVQLMADSHMGVKRFLQIESFIFCSAAFMPLMVPPLARLNGEAGEDGRGTRLLMIAITLLPVSLLICQPYLKAAFLLLGVCTVFLLCTGPKKLKRFLIAAALLLCFTVIVAAATGLFSSHYTVERLSVIFTRGKNSPYDWGYQRVLLDQAFAEAELWGKSQMVVQTMPPIPISWFMLDWSDYLLMVVLTRMGWIAMVAVLAVSAVFLVLVFRMVHKTRQSVFAHSVSLLSGLFLLFGIAISVISLFLLECSYYNPPFMFRDEETAVITFALFAVIVRLYLDRDKPSEIAELDVEEKKTMSEEYQWGKDDWVWDDDALDVISTGEYPANMLSNFYPHQFTIDGVSCGSMEGFLQSLKTWNPELQEKVCLMTGKEAKEFFRRRPENLLWKLTGWLYWRGEIYDRFSDDYQHLLNRSYLSLLKNEDFAKALLDTEGRVLIHSKGKTNSKSTILTEYEFINRLYDCRLLAESQGKEKK